MMNRLDPIRPVLMFSRALLLLALPLPVVAQETQPAVTEATSVERAAERPRIMAIAERYASHRWHAAESNVLHGSDPDGTRVDTPDVTLGSDGWHPDGRENVGIPYMWGGFSSLEEFDRGVARGMYAGHVPARETAGASRHAVGVDCSGFVSRCWDLPQKQSTRSLGRLCYELAGFDELLPGDIVNSFDGHVVLFEEFADPEHTQMRVYEAARLRVKRSDYAVADLEAGGYVPLRYKPLDERWVPMLLSEPSFSSTDTARQGRWRPDSGAPKLEFGEMANPLVDAESLEWARYNLTDSGGGTTTAVRMVAGVDGDQVAIQSLERIGDKDLATGSSADRASTMAEALLDFAEFSERPDPLEVVVSSVAQGSYELGGRRFSARKITAFLEGTITIRHTSYPLTLEIECIQSDEVPLHGILEASYRVEVTWGTDAAGDPAVRRSGTSFALLEFGNRSAGAGER